MRNLIQHVLERSSKIGRTWAGLNDNELWLSKDDNDTTSEIKPQKKKSCSVLQKIAVAACMTSSHPLNECDGQHRHR